MKYLHHDEVSDLRYINLFEDICDYKEVYEKLGKDTVRLVLFHYPILMWKNQHRGAIHLYGHLHNSEEEAFFQKCVKELNEYDLGDRQVREKRMCAYNVGCMMPYMDYEPRTLEEIVAYYAE